MFKFFVKTFNYDSYPTFCTAKLKCGSRPTDSMCHRIFSETLCQSNWNFHIIGPFTLFTFVGQIVTIRLKYNSVVLIRAFI